MKRLRFAVPKLGISCRIGFHRILLSFNDDPAAITLEFLQHPNIVDHAVARNRINTGQHAVEERPVFAVRLPHDILADILAMHMADARLVMTCQTCRIAAAPGGMAGIEQEVHRIAGRFHEAIDLGFGLHDRAHMMVVDQLQPIGLFRRLAQSAYSARRKPSRRI